MKFLVILMLINLSSVISAPATDESQAIIENYENNIDEKGNYRFSFKTSNGLKRTENGEIKNAGLPNEYIEVTGEYSYIDANGELVEVTYFADENGFHIVPKVEPISAINPNVVASLLGG